MPGNAAVAASIPGGVSKVQSIPGNIVECNVDTRAVLNGLDALWHKVAFLRQRNPINQAPEPIGDVRLQAATTAAREAAASVGAIADDCPDTIRDEVASVLAGISGPGARITSTNWQPAKEGLIAGAGAPNARVVVEPLGKDFQARAPGMGTVGASTSFADADSMARTAGATAGATGSYTKDGAAVGGNASLNASRTGTTGQTVTNGATQAIATEITPFTGTLVIRLRVEIQGDTELDVLDTEMEITAGRFGAISMVGFP